MYKILWFKNHKRRDYLEDLGVDGKILEWISGKWGKRVWNGVICSG
jgi:hypothetical protein